MTDKNDIPDFSGDDFANDRDILRTRAAIKAYQQMIEESISVIQNNLDVTEASHKNFKDFFMFKSLQAIILSSYKTSTRSGSLHISLATYSSVFPTAKSVNAGTDQYLFGYLTTSKKYPRTYIHKETIREKITDLFLRRELDFEHSKKFSRKFHVLTEDKNKLSDMFQFTDLDRLIEFPEMELEFFDSACLFRNSRKPISPEEASAFCELSKCLMAVFG